MDNFFNKLKAYALGGLALMIGWLLVSLKLKGDKLARLEARDLVSDENTKQKALDEAVQKAKEEYEARD